MKAFRVMNLLIRTAYIIFQKFQRIVFSFVCVCVWLWLCEFGGHKIALGTFLRIYLPCFSERGSLTDLGSTIRLEASWLPRSKDVTISISPRLELQVQFVVVIGCLFILTQVLGTEFWSSCLQIKRFTN